MDKKSKLLALGLGAMAALGISSCQDYTEFTEGQIKQDLYNKQYDEAFIKIFGEPDPDFKWGMDEEIGVIEGLSTLDTRAGSVEVNRNQWTEFDNNAKHDVTFPYHGTNTPDVKVPDYRTSALGHDIQIPGFPHLNGLYYTAQGNILSETKTGDQITSGMIPAGDVTPYEIQYVSNWFRTHKITNPEDYRMNLHLSDFFIQNVSCDYDQVEYRENGDEVTPYSEGWPLTGNNGKNISSFAEVNSLQNDGVLKNKDGGPYATNLTENISYDLDNLGFKSIDGEWTHVNNFNRGNSNFSPEDNRSNPNREIKYIKSAGTEDFRCHPSWCTKTDWIYSWVLVRLTWVETVKDPHSPYTLGTAIPREGYYLAFDFHGEKDGQNNQNQVVNQDGYYSNWIVKITPGHFTETGKSRRIFCEDLGGNYDFDFNDAVIDVAFEGSNGSYTPIINVQAAGGTMPIYVEKHTGDKNRDSYELHNMLGASTTTPVNVGTTTHPVATYRATPVPNTNPGQIKIYVENTRNGLTYTVSGTKGNGIEDERSQLDEETGGESGITLDGNTYEDTSKKAPRAFSAPTTVQWMKEIKRIDDVYTKFKDWVTTPESNQSWYNTKSNQASALLFDNSHIEPAHENPTGGGGSVNEPIDWKKLTPDTSRESVDATNSVKADSYMRLQGYQGLEDKIRLRLDSMGDNLEGRITCTLVLSSTTKYNQTTYNQNGQTFTMTKGTPLEGIIVPANIENSTMTYKGSTFSASNFKRFNTATYVEGNKEFGNDVNTYTIQFSFAKSDLVKEVTEDGEGNNVYTYYDYLLFFLRVGQNGGDNPTYYRVGDGDSHGVTINYWYVHY